MKKFRISVRHLYIAVALLLLAAVGSSILVTTPLAKYITSTTGSDGARVAKFDVTIAGQLTKSFTIPTMNPGDKQEFTVQVTNKSEVTVSFRIAVENPYTNLPLTYVMTDADGKVIENGTIPAGDTAERTYKLRIQWLDENNSPDYAEKVDLLTIRLIAEQVD